MTRGGPYRSTPRSPTDIRVVRLTRPGTRRWGVPVGAALLLVFVAVLASYAWVRIECDTKRRSCLVTEHRLAFTRARVVDGVTAARRTASGAVELVTESGIEPTLRWSPLVPAYNVAGEFVAELTTESAAECEARLRATGCEQTASSPSLCHPSPPHVDASLVADPGTLAWMTLVGVLSLVAGLVAFGKGLLAVRGVPLQLHLARRALAVPRLDHDCRARELPMDGIVDVVIRAEHEGQASPHIAMFVVLANGESVRMTPISTEKISALEPSRCALAEALGLDAVANPRTYTERSGFTRARVVRRLLGATMVVGLFALLGLPSTMWGRGEDLALGTFLVQGTVAFLGSIAMTRLLAPLVVRTMGGTEAAATELRRVAMALRAPRLFASVATLGVEGTIAQSVPTVRNGLALLLLPLIFSLSLGLVEYLNAVKTTADIRVHCTSSHVRSAGPAEWSADVVCTTPTGKQLWGSGRFVAPPRAEFASVARRGALGVWLLPKSEAR